MTSSELIGRGARRIAAVMVSSLLAGALGCGHHGPETMPGPEAVRPASGAPARFEPGNRRALLQPADTLAGSGCLSPLIDPRDRGVARLVRSAGGVGDYAGPPGRYGAGLDELLRIECNTGRLLGLVPR